MKKKLIAIATTILMLSSLSSTIAGASEIVKTSPEVKSVTQKSQITSTKNFNNAQELIDYINNDTAFDLTNNSISVVGSLTLSDISNIVNVLGSWQERAISSGITLSSFPYDISLGDISDYSTEDLQKINDKLEIMHSALGDDSYIQIMLNFSDDATKENNDTNGRYLPGETIRLVKGQTNYTLDLSKYGVSGKQSDWRTLYLGVNDDIHDIQNNSYDISYDSGQGHYKIEDLQSVDFSDLDSNVKTLNLYYNAEQTKPFLKSTAIWRHLSITPEGGSTGGTFGSPDELIGTMFSIPIEWVDPIPNSKVTVKYVDEDGLEIHDVQSLSGNVGEAYDATTVQYKLSISGYTLDETKLPANAKGTFSAEDQTVTYVYNKNTPPVETSTVTTKYVDESGKSISKDDIQNGNIGADYTTKSKVISGYTLDETKLPANAKGTFSGEDQTVTYVYNKNIPPVETSTVTTKYVDESGKSISKDDIQNGNIGADYTTKSKVISGYILDETKLPANAKGTFSAEDQTVTYVYKKDSPQNSNSTSKTEVPTNTIKNNSLQNNSSSKSFPNTGENMINSVYVMVIGLVIVIFTAAVLVLKRVKNK